MNPIVAVFLGWIFYREPFGMAGSIAMWLVITGVVVVKYFDLMQPKAQAVSTST